MYWHTYKIYNNRNCKTDDNEEPDTCPWQGQMGSLNDHLKHCDFVKVPCPNEGCDESMQRRHMAGHAGVDCEYRLMPCVHCGNDQAVILLDGHVAACDRRPVECTSQCGEVVIAAELGEHLQERCVLRMVSCPLHAMGGIFFS